MKCIFYVIFVCLFYAQSTIYASSSTHVAVYTNDNKLPKMVISAPVFCDIMLRDKEIHRHNPAFPMIYPLTIAKINHPGFDVVIDATAKDYTMHGALRSRHEKLWPHHFALQDESHHQAALAIVRTFPTLINKRDSKGNTALHYYCASNPADLSDLPQMLELFKHQLRIPNKRELIPIHMACNAHLLLCLYVAGAPLDNQIINTCSPYWKKNESVLGALHALGFDSNILATKFQSYAPSIEKAAYNLKEANQIGLYKLLLAIRAKDYDRVITIAQTRPRFVEITDIEGSTALHYLADENALLTKPDSFFPHRLKKFFGHQLNIRNNAGATPIYCTSDPHMFITLHVMGAQLDGSTIARIRPTKWSNLPILAILAHIGFSTNFLSRTFDHNKLEIEQAHIHYRSTIRGVMHTMSLCLNRERVGSSSLSYGLSLREQYGRTTKSALLTRTKLIQSAKRLQRTDDEATDPAKYARTS